MPVAPATASRLGPGLTRTAGETIDRINQDARQRTTARTSKAVSGRDRDGKPTGWFANELPTNQTMTGTVSRAKRHPAGFACQERSTRPRTNHANEVVMPQVGHNRPVTVAKVQGGSPSCMCVPKPRGSGSSVFANPRSPASPAAPIRSTQRVGQPNGCAAQRCRINGRAIARIDEGANRAGLKGHWKGIRNLPEERSRHKSNPRVPTKEPTTIKPA
jgi:hypothetical protein